MNKEPGETRVRTVLPHVPVVLTLPRRMRETTAHVDADIAPIIQALWRRGYQTRFCCQGDPGTDAGDYLGQQAYIAFGTSIEAALFYAYCGPAKWTNKQHAERHRERPEGAERWLWDWRLEGDTVRFPARDLQRVAKSAARIPSLRTLIGALSATNVPLRSAPPTCPHCGLDLHGAHIAAPDPHRSEPRLCATCGAVVVSRRKDARYCSRRCQLAARDRRGTKDEHEEHP